jgi:geranylgeranyl pyrophosphate synthase
MVTNIFSSIRQDIKQVEEMLLLSSKGADKNLLLDKWLNVPSLHVVIHPASVILAARLFKEEINEQVITLACTIQYIYLGLCLHQKINENKEMQRTPQKEQYAILVGDSFYCQNLALLCRVNLTAYIQLLAEVMGEINLGSILRLKSQNFFTEAIQKEAGALVACACRLGGRVAGATIAQENILAKFGLKLGTAFGFLKYQREKEQIFRYLNKAREDLALLPPEKARDTLSDLIDLLMNQGTKIDQRLVG